MRALESGVRTWAWGTVVAALLVGPGSSAFGRSGNYLIVTAEDYYSSTPLTQLIDSKTAQGLDVMTYTVPSGTSNTAILSYIEGLWGTPEAPDYILIVGDTNGSTSTANTIPHWTGEASRHACTDLYYGCMDGGDDWYPEITIGRYSVQTISQLQDVVDKTLYVEGGIYDDPNYAKRAAFLATSDTTSGAAETHDWVIDKYLTPAEFECTRIYAAEGGGTSDVTDAVNNGVLFVVYGGHSSSSGWSEPYFNQSHVQALTNAEMYPLVFGWSCNSAHYSYDECFGETWLRVANRGAAAYLSASDLIFWGSWEAWEPSRQLEKYFFKSFFGEQIWEVGPAWQTALYRFLADYGAWDGDPTHPPEENYDVCRNFFEEFVLLGDPSLLLPGGFGFALNAAPEVQELCSPPTDEAVYTIDVEQLGDFSEAVTLSADGAPSGASIVFSVNAVPPPFTSEMTVSNVSAGSPGEYEITITGAVADEQRQTTVLLNLSDSMPGEVILTSPVDGAEDVSRTPTLAWEEASQAAHYGLEVATDADFMNIVISTAVSGSTYTPAVRLEPATLYFWHVRALNGCGQSDFSATFSFTTLEQPDYFTEEFMGGIDLEALTVAFIPDGSGDCYDVCSEEATDFPTDPSGGTVISPGEDGWVHVQLSGGETVLLYAASYDGFYVNSNGNITFNGGDSTWNETLPVHFNQPRISALFDDFSPQNGGTISWKQLSDRVAVTFEDVPEYGTSNDNTFQIEMYFDGEIRITWLSTDASDGIIGLSEGNGVPDDFIASDLSSAHPCGPRPPTAVDGEVSTPANWPITITLEATDDGLPEPPSLDLIVGWLPEHGELSDPGAGVIEGVPYTLVDSGNEVVYTPDRWYMGDDYFQFYANDGGEPPEGGDSNIASVLIHVTVPVPEPIIVMSLDSDPGWSTEGQWAFGQPTGGGSHNYDPTGGHTGNNVYGYNLAGDYTNDMPLFNLTTTAIDCTDLLLTELHFWRWLGVERSPYDSASVEISNDGMNWTPLWANPGSTVADHEWVEMVFDISAIADDQPTVYVRWGMGPTDGGATYPGWNIDDLAIWGLDTSEPCPGDLDRDGDVDLADLAQLLANYGTTSGASYEDGDLDADGDVDLADLAALLAVYGTTCP